MAGREWAIRRPRKRPTDDGRLETKAKVAGGEQTVESGWQTMSDEKRPTKIDMRQGA